MTGAICGDGMCPYIPCRNFPNCNHLEEQLKFERKFEVKTNGKTKERMGNDKSIPSNKI